MKKWRVGSEDTNKIFSSDQKCLEVDMGGSRLPESVLSALSGVEAACRDPAFVVSADAPNGPDAMIAASTNLQRCV